ncbi:MAG: hypothetical protein J6Y36_06965 [Treponema sp.]|nr:hypothetical protein [Treponema sp.]
MIKKFFLGLFFSLISCCVFAETVSIAEIIIYDSQGKDVSILRNPEKDLQSSLSHLWFNGLIDFDVATKKSVGPVASSLDALKACNKLGRQFIIYGYMKKSDVNYYLELKLYNVEEKKVVTQFFASDGIENYDRMIADVTTKIEVYFKELYDIKTEEERQEEYQPLELALPMSLNYWVPLHEDWAERLYGIVGINAGIDFYPEFKVYYLDNKMINFSLRAEFAYKYGMGNPNFYPINLHSFSFATYSMFNVHFNDTHSCTFGLGPIYELDIYQITKKYEDATINLQNLFGIGLLGGYYYNLNDKWKLLGELELQYFFGEGSYMVLKPKLGAVYTFYKRR